MWLALALISIALYPFLPFIISLYIYLSDSWKKIGGKSHLIFNLIPGEHPHYNTILDVQTAEAILAGGSFSYSSYRPGFDVSIPVINSLTRFPVGEKNTQ